MEEESGNELDELQESTIKNKLLSSARNGIDTAINYIDSSASQKLQEYYAHLRTVRDILSKGSGMNWANCLQWKRYAGNRPESCHKRTHSLEAERIEKNCAWKR